MSVVKIDNGVVVQTWRDVETVEDVVAKYGLDQVDLVEGDHPPGTLYDGSRFSPPQRRPPPELSATGAQMIDEAKSRNKLGTLLTVLTASERAVFFTRRRIVAGSNFAEVLRAKLGIGVVAMKNFITSAALRSED